MPGTCAGVPRLTPRRHALCRRRPAVFSLLKAMFGDARATSLSDLIEGSLMLKFNKAKRKAEKEAMAQAAGPN
jgi:hypothetical protein